METISLRIIRGGHELTTVTWLHLPPEVSTIAPELSVKTTKNKQKKTPEERVHSCRVQQHKGPLCTYTREAK